MVASAVLAMFEVTLPDAVFALLVVPIAVQEMVMAFWLIIKGFDTSEHIAGSRNTKAMEAAA
jgi:hypothetical protein